MINTSSARAAIAIATGNGWKAKPHDVAIRVQVSYGGSNVAEVLHGLDCARVLSALKRVPKPERYWLLYAYAAEGWQDEANLTRQTAEVHALSALIDIHHQRRTVRSPGRLAMLARVAMAERRRAFLEGLVDDEQGTYRVREFGFTPAQICAASGIDLSNWVRKWRDNYDALKAVLNDWDREGLTPIAASLPAWTREGREGLIPLAVVEDVAPEPKRKAYQRKPEGITQGPAEPVTVKLERPVLALK